MLVDMSKTNVPYNVIVAKLICSEQKRMLTHQVTVFIEESFFIQSEQRLALMEYDLVNSIVNPLWKGTMNVSNLTLRTLGYIILM